MKISNWIKLIGILCIVFGASGLMDSISFLFLSGVIENQDKWVVNHAYLGTFISALYLVAGVFFLMKKPFSLNLMYTVLTISLMYGIGSMFLISRINIFSFISPIIDTALLIGVFSVSKYYYKSPEELDALDEENSKRKSLTQRQLKIFSFVSLICFLIPLSIFGLWIYAADLGTTQAESVEIFHSYFPRFLQGRYDTAYLSIIFCIASIIFASISLKLSEILWKSMNIIVLILSSLLLLLNLFGLM